MKGNHPHDTRVNPACAGMIRLDLPTTTLTGGKPRVCGDDPPGDDLFQDGEE